MDQFGDLRILNHSNHYLKVLHLLDALSWLYSEYSSLSRLSQNDYQLRNSCRFCQMQGIFCCLSCGYFRRTCILIKMSFYHFLTLILFSGLICAYISKQHAHFLMHCCLCVVDSCEFLKFHWLSGSQCICSSQGRAFL